MKAITIISIVQSFALIKIATYLQQQSVEQSRADSADCGIGLFLLPEQIVSYTFTVYITK